MNNKTLYKPWTNRHYGHDEYHFLYSSASNAPYCDANRLRETHNDISTCLNSLVSTLQPSVPVSSNQQCGAVLFSPLDTLPLEHLMSCAQPVSISSIICSTVEKTMYTKESLFSIQRPTSKLLLPGPHTCHIERHAYETLCLSAISGDGLFGWLGLKVVEYKVDKICNKSSINDAQAIRISKYQLDNFLQEFKIALEFLEMYNQHFTFIDSIFFKKNSTEKVLKELKKSIKKMGFHHIERFSSLHHRWIVGTFPRYNNHMILCEEKPVVKEFILNCSKAQFRCLDGSCVSDMYRCDKHKDCEESEDEMNCPHVCLINGKAKYTELECMVPLCTWLNCQCGILYVYIGLTGCYRLAALETSRTNIIGQTLTLNKKTRFICKDGKSISVGMVDDLVPDCTTLDDEKEYTKLLYNRTLNPEAEFPRNCFQENITQAQCIAGHSRCFPRDKLCVVDHDNIGHLRHCRNGLHLLHCEHMECVGMFKCPNMYCLPVHKLCNGVKDCMFGEDESMCDLPLSCPAMFRCKAGFCVDQQYICDSIPQCPNNDDELYCNVGKCPDSCTCIGSSFDCSGVGLVTLPSSGIQVFVGNNNKIKIEKNFI